MYVGLCRALGYHHARELPQLYQQQQHQQLYQQQQHQQQPPSTDQAPQKAVPGSTSAATAAAAAAAANMWQQQQQQLLMYQYEQQQYMLQQQQLYQQQQHQQLYQQQPLSTSSAPSLGAMKTSTKLRTAKAGKWKAAVLDSVLRNYTAHPHKYTELVIKEMEELFPGTKITPDNVRKIKWRLVVCKGVHCGQSYLRSYTSWQNPLAMSIGMANKACSTCTLTILSQYTLPDCINKTEVQMF
jgi:hypothetical protein